MADPVSQQLLARIEDGDNDAACELFDRYAQRLIGMARKRLSSKLARRVDAEDIVQSAYRSFFADAAAGKFQLEESGDLWRLLVAITLNKLRSKARFHRAVKRDVEQEDSMSGQVGIHGIPPDRMAAEPSPEEAMALAESIESLMTDLTALERRMLELRLQEHTLEEIAEKVDRSERTVRRLLSRLRDRLAGDLDNEMVAG